MRILSKYVLIIGIWFLLFAKFFPTSFILDREPIRLDLGPDISFASHIFYYPTEYILTFIQQPVHGAVHWCLMVVWAGIITRLIKRYLD